MAGWDLTVLSAALSIVGGIVWAMARLALTGKKVMAKESVLNPAEAVDSRPKFVGIISFQEND